MTTISVLRKKPQLNFKEAISYLCSNKDYKMLHNLTIESKESTQPQRLVQKDARSNNNCHRRWKHLCISCTKIIFRTLDKIWNLYQEEKLTNTQDETIGGQFYTKNRVNKKILCTIRWITDILSNIFSTLWFSASVQKPKLCEIAYNMCPQYDFCLSIYPNHKEIPFHTH